MADTARQATHAALKKSQEALKEADQAIQQTDVDAAKKAEAKAAEARKEIDNQVMGDRSDSFTVAGYTIGELAQAFVKPPEPATKAGADPEVLKAYKEVKKSQKEVQKAKAQVEQKQQEVKDFQSNEQRELTKLDEISQKLQ